MKGRHQKKSSMKQAEMKGKNRYVKVRSEAPANLLEPECHPEASTTDLQRRSAPRFTAERRQDRPGQATKYMSIALTKRSWYSCGGMTVTSLPVPELRPCFALYSRVLAKV